MSANDIQVEEEMQMALAESSLKIRPPPPDDDFGLTIDNVSDNAVDGGDERIEHTANQT